MNVETDEVPLISDMKRPQVISPAAFFVRLDLNYDIIIQIRLRPLPP